MGNINTGKIKEMSKEESYISHLVSLKGRIYEKEIDLNDITACAYHEKTIQKNGTMISIEPPFMRQIFGLANEDYICIMIHIYIELNDECNEIKVLNPNSTDMKGYLLSYSKLKEIFNSLDEMIKRLKEDNIN